MAIAQKTMISFGMVAIPIEMYTATQDNDIHFNQLYKEDHSRIRYKKTCAHCGDEVKAADIVKGYEFDKDRYVVITDEEMEKIKTEKEKSIEIVNFVNLDEISPVYFEKSYQAVPQAGGEKAFELLREALMEEGKVAIGRSVLGTKDTLLALMPREEGMIIFKMFFDDEIKNFEEKYKKPKVSKAELQMAKTLIDAMDSPFSPEDYQDEYQQKLRDLIQTKIAGKEVVAPQEEKQEGGTVLNLMDALKASVKKASDKKADKKADKKTDKNKGTA